LSFKSLEMFVIKSDQFFAFTFQLGSGCHGSDNWEMVEVGEGDCRVEMCERAHRHTLGEQPNPVPEVSSVQSRRSMVCLNGKKYNSSSEESRDSSLATA